MCKVYNKYMHTHTHTHTHTHGLPSSKESTCNIGGVSSIPGSERSPGGSLLQHSCLENPMDRGAWRATTHGVAKS